MKQAYHIPERFLRQLWKHQQFVTTHLRTIDDRPVEIISPGKVNGDGGPDFHDARIRIDGIVYRGDVELHQRDDDWLNHLHHLDPKYNSVILHVIFRRENPPGRALTASKRSIPVLALEPFLDAPYKETWQQMILNERAERLSTIKCYGKNSQLEASQLKKCLTKLAVERIELKVRRFEERLKDLTEKKRQGVSETSSHYEDAPFGLNPEDLPSPFPTYSQRDFSRVSLWQELLYEGIMEALGYTKNQEPFLKLARALPLNTIETATKRREKEEEDVLALEALLFHAAGLLPALSAIKDQETRKYIQRLHEHRAWHHGETFDGAEWQFFRLRPENFPTVRLAGAARLIPLLLKKSFFRNVIQVIKRREDSRAAKSRELTQLFVVPSDGFWLNHYQLHGNSEKRVAKLIGENRAEEIVINVVLPLAFLYARIFHDKEVRQGALALFEEIQPPSQNTITRTIETQLLRKKLRIDSALLYQGALQLYKFYCADERCEECCVGKMTD